MEYLESLNALAAKIRQQASSIATEEATKNAFVMPFIKNVLGYDVFDPTEVVPEFICDVGTKKGEKIDYAILKDGQIQMLIECKKIGEPLNVNHASQLFRYFHVTTARISILTNGRVYKFFTDLDAPNKMDEKPFLELDLLDVDEHSVPELAKLTKSTFDVESIISAAGELKYIGQIKREITAQFAAPGDEFLRFFTTRVYDGVITAKVREQFQPLLSKAIAQFTGDLVNDRLKSAITGVSANMSLAFNSSPPEPSSPNEPLVPDDELRIVTTEEELEGFFVVKSIVRTAVESNRIGHRDTQSYFGILLDDNNRKPICRLHFNRAQKYIGILDADKKETRYPISSLDEIYSLSDALIEATKRVA
ncbi:type I restriction endonuclease [Acidovorax sp. FJL06]|uniref:type I restriction endonuclease n=1 Tax=Acidovorax sp. FJL06 TaxID=2153365 RepID=UPI000F564742|nr:type I restriction endonuclease [Acidovorax sp. FJL06]RQO82884.1 restriction endonuclease [Acidovorax sp. FJL06]